jgi:hypothetical protein
MRIGIVFAVIVTVLGDWFVGGELLKPNVEVVMKTGLVIVDED